MSQTDGVDRGIHRNFQPHENLCRLLAKLELINEEALQQGNEFPSQFPIAHFALAGFYEEDQALKLVADELNLSFWAIEQNEHGAITNLLEREPVSQVTVASWRDYRATPLGITDEEITIAMADPLDLETRTKLEFQLARSVKIYLGKESQILAALEGGMRTDGASLDFICKSNEHLTVKPTYDSSRKMFKQESSVGHDDPSAPTIVRIVNKVFADVIERGASDLHITPQKDALLVRARVDGIMNTIYRVPEEHGTGVISRIKLLSGLDISERRRPQDGRLRLKTPHGVKDLRISTMASTYGENLVARILSSDFAYVSFESLGMSEALQSRLTRAHRRSSRVNLVTGPTGSGKSSTLYASVINLRDGKSNIITLEDPVECRIPGLAQIQVDPKIDFSFADGLRSALRQDPDIILVGEIRDSETAQIAMQAAQTGHLVLSSLHTNSASGAITRLQDLGVPDFVVAAALGSVVAQRLVRALCECSIPADDELVRRCRELGLDPEGVCQPGGCSNCDNTGYRGRTGLFSFLEVTDDVAAAIRENAGEHEVAERAREAGFETLFEASLELLQNGRTSLEELERVLGPFEQFVAGTQALRHSAPGIVANGDDIDIGLGKRKLLLVEDDETIRSVFRLLFEREMFEVVEATDGQRGLEKLYEELPDIVVCDVMMPQMSGQQFLQRVRADNRIAHVPVLMLTANPSEEIELDLICQGADDFVPKTTGSEIVLARVRRLLEGR